MEIEQYFDNDELKIYRGQDYIISKNIKIHQPTLGEICDQGEAIHYSMIHNFVSTPASLKAQLWDVGIDFTEISCWQLFYQVIYKTCTVDSTSILFGNLDFSKFIPMKKNDDDSVVLYQEIDGEPVIFDEYTYNLTVDYICRSYFIQRDMKMPANNSTKLIMIEDAQDFLIHNKNKKYESTLVNLISSMVNSEGFKYNHQQIWDMKINAFMDSVKRIGKIKNAQLLLQSGYSGFGIDLKKIDNSQIDWLGKLD